MTTQVTKDHGARQLLADLEAAERNFNDVALTVAAATDFLSLHKGALNEQQFGQKLEAASSNIARAEAVIAAQNKLRTSYMSARLALFCTFSKLVRARDKFVRMVTKITATLPALKKDSPSDFDLLSSRALEAVQRCNQAYQRAGERREREWGRDLTEGQAANALTGAYEKLVSGGSNDFLPHNGEASLFLTPLTGADLMEYRFCDAALNDQVVTAGNTVLALLASEGFRMTWNFYHVNKGALNEPQYRSRLAQHIQAKNEAAVGVVKNQQQHARVQYLGSRSSVTEFYRQALELAAQLSVLNEQLKEKFASDTSVGANGKLTVMNNILAADAIVRHVNALQAKWADELAATTEIGETSSASLIERLAAEVSKEPYRSLGWTYRGDGTYIEPL